MMRSLLKNKIFSDNIGMEVKEKPPDEFFKCVKVSLKHVTSSV